MIQTLLNSKRKWKSNKDQCKLSKNSEITSKAPSVSLFIKINENLPLILSIFRWIELLSGTCLWHDISWVLGILRAQVFAISIQICYGKDIQYQKCNHTGQVYEQSHTWNRFLKKLIYFRASLETKPLRSTESFTFSKNNEIY
jgi:hypothetical protein